MDKRQARRDAKSAPAPVGGVYVVRCANGETFVGSHPNLKAAETGLMFSLRQGGHINKALLKAYNANPSAQFEILETLPEDLAAMLVRETLRTRQKHWMAELGVGAV